MQKNSFTSSATISFSRKTQLHWVTQFASYIPAVVTVYSLRSVSNLPTPQDLLVSWVWFPPYEAGPRPIPSPRLPDPVNSCAGIPLLRVKSNRNGSVTVTGLDFAGLEATKLNRTVVINFSVVVEKHYRELFLCRTGLLTITWTFININIWKDVHKSRVPGRPWDKIF